MFPHFFLSNKNIRWLWRWWNVFNKQEKYYDKLKIEVLWMEKHTSLKLMG